MIFNKIQTTIYFKIFITTLLTVFLFINLNVINANAQRNNIDNDNSPNIYVYNHAIIHDKLDKNVSIVGSVAGSNNLPPYPLEVTLGFDVYNTYSKKYETLIGQPFEKVIYDISHPIPFKFTINSSKYYFDSNSIPYVKSIKKADIHSTKINTFTLDYNESRLGPSKELFGTVVNTGPSILKNLTLYADVHAKNGSQIDSVKTIIPLINPQQKVNFTFTPDKAIKNLVFTYSCVGGELQDINAYQTIKLNPQKTLGYKFSGFMEINSINYNNKTNSVKLEVNNIYPVSAALSLQLKPTQYAPLNILIDNHKFESQAINDSEKTTLDMFIPQGKHEIYIQGISS
ncbi:MAG: hypothetical protein ACTHME_08990 [Candidatus Nitrosocosmicus sp.]